MESPDKKQEVKIGQISFSPNAVELFRDEYERRGKITREQAAEVTSVLQELGPQLAIQKLASFLEQLPQ